MELIFNPPTSELPQIQFRPHMIETAYDYFKTTNSSQHKRGNITCTLSALSIEIILKSFNSIIIGNKSTPLEAYQFDKSVLPKKQKWTNNSASAHNLLNLAKAIPPEIQNYLFDKYDWKTIEEHQETFTKSRYIYEHIDPNGTTDDLEKLAASLICKVIFLYKIQKCNDPFIINFKVDSLYFTHVQQFISIQKPDAK
jgi:hypothetical protein